MSFRTYGWGNGGGSGLSRQTGITIAGVAVGVVVVGLVLCFMYRRRRNTNRFKNHPPPRLPTHMSQLPPPPAAYIRPTSTPDLPSYRPPQGAPPSGSHAAWAAPAPPYQPPSPAPPKETPVVTSPPANRRSIFRRPVPPLYTSDDLAPPPSPVPGAQAQVLPQVTPYESRRGERPFGPAGLDGRHPGVPESEAGDVGMERRRAEVESQDAPPGYAETSGRA